MTDFTSRFVQKIWPCLTGACIVLITFLMMFQVSMPVWLWSVVLTIACVGAVIWARNHVLLRWHIAELSTAFEHDRVATFLAGHGGRIVFLNPAARALVGQGGKMSIADAFSRVFPNGPSIIGRILADLDQGTYGQDDVQMPQTRFEISAKRLSHGVLWRVHVMQNPKLTTALPMLIVGRDEGILAQNDAMRALIGDGACGLDDVFETRPVVSGAPVGMKTPSGAVTVIPIVQHHNDATQDIYITQPDMAIVPPSSGGIAAALDVLPVALLHIAPEGGVLAANGQAKAMLGLQDDTTHHLSSLLEGLGRPVADWVDDILEGRLPDRSEIMRARLKEDDCFLQVTLSRILEGETASVLAVLQDATELKTMEQKFIQSQKMQAIGELAGGIAHDFNNLLTAIRGHCDLLMMGLAPDAPGYTDLDQINQTVNRAAGLVNQLLGFSRKQRIEPEIIDLSDAMGELMHLLNRLVGKKIKLNLVHSSDSVCIRADPRQLEQVIMNLVLNARDAMPGGGQVFVETTPVTLDAPLHRDNVEIPAGSYVLLKVRDEGHGIADDKRARIFEPFFTTKRTGEGTGLGLSMVYGIVKQTGGYVFVDSVLGQGTTFSIYYPSYERPAQSDTGHGPDREAQKNQPAGPLHVSGATILLVEDEASVRRFAARALQLQGHIVIEAENAEDALNLLPQIMHQVDLFVTDIVMPGMDGPTWVARALRDVPDVQTIFISGYADGLPDQDISHIPGAVFLQKPFSLKQLVHVVQTQLSDR